MRQRDTGRDVLTFVAGALFGAGMALLYSPKTGKEIRDTVSDFTDDALAKMKEYGSTAQEKMKSTFYRGKEMAEEKMSAYGAREPGKEEMVH